MVRFNFPFKLSIGLDYIFDRIQMERTQVICSAGLVTFERGGRCRFGKTVLVVLPPHGELNCECMGCELYRIVEVYRDAGWQAIRVTRPGETDEDSDRSDSS